MKKAAEQWILDRSTLRRIEERTDVGYVTKWRNAQKYADHVPHPLIHYMRNRARASHILLLDAIFIKVKGEERAVMIAYDTGIGVINYWIDVSENAMAYSVVFQQLDMADYEPICVVSDRCISILKAIGERNLPHQLCIFHLLKQLRDWLTVSGEFRRPKDKLLFNRIHHIFMTNNIEYLPRRIERFKIFENAFDGRDSIFEWFWEVVPKALLHLSYQENIPRTTNHIENLNKRIRQRFKTFYGVKSEDSLRKTLRVFFYLQERK